MSREFACAKAAKDPKGHRAQPALPASALKAPAHLAGASEGMEIDEVGEEGGRGKERREGGRKGGKGEGEEGGGRREGGREGGTERLGRSLGF